MCMYYNIDIAFLLLATFVIISTSQVSANESRYSAVYNANGKAMCALLQPIETSSVRSQLECSSRCKKNDKCTGFNYREQSQQQQQLASVCETFNGATSLGVVENCVYFELRETCATNIATNGSMKPVVGNPLLIQQNVAGSNFFDRTWQEFKCGFGSSNGNYWLGNELLHQLTMNNTYKLRFDLQSRDNNSLWFWVEYSTFIVGSETTNYTLQVGEFRGNVDIDAFSYHNGLKFSTKDRDNDMGGGNCAQQRHGGFWYTYDCSWCNVNGEYPVYYYWAWLTSSYRFLQTSRMWLVCR